MARALRTPVPGRDMLEELERRRRPRDVAAKRLLRRLARAELARARAVLDTGACLHELLRERLYANLGYGTFAGLLGALGIGRSQAFKLMALAARSTAEQIAARGVEGAYREIAAPRAPPRAKATRPANATARPRNKRGATRA